LPLSLPLLHVRACPWQVAVVLGTQWGDEGKGKLVDILAGQYEVVARAQVSASGPSYYLPVGNP